MLRRNRPWARNGQENGGERGAEAENGLSSTPALLGGERGCCKATRPRGVRTGLREEFRLQRECSGIQGVTGN